MHVTAATLVAALRTEGLRVTAARRAICEVLAESHDEHLSANDVLVRARFLAHQDINESTVYRTIETLEGLDLIAHVHLGHGPGVLHMTDTSAHQHLVCRNCGKVVDVAWDEVQPLVDQIAAAHGFAVDGSHFALEGMCAECRV